MSDTLQETEDRIKDSAMKVIKKYQDEIAQLKEEVKQLKEQNNQLTYRVELYRDMIITNNASFLAKTHNQLEE